MWATLVELAGGEVPQRWDGRSFAEGLRSAEPTGRDDLVLSHGAWTAQRSVRFDRWLCIRTYHDAFHGFPDVLLFDVEADPFEQHDRAADRPEVVEHALAVLADWSSDALARSHHGTDPLWSVLTGGGPWHSRVDVPWYLDRLRATGRGMLGRAVRRAGLARAGREPLRQRRRAAGARGLSPGTHRPDGRPRRPDPACRLG